MGLKSNQISIYEQWKLSQALCHHCPSTPCIHKTPLSIRFVAGLVFTFLLCQPSGYLSVPKTLKCRVEGSMSAPAQLLYVQCVVSLVAFTNRDLLSVCGEKPIDMAIVWVVWEFPWDPICPTTKLDVTQAWYQKFHLVKLDGHLGFCHHHYLAIPFRLPLYMYIF